MHSKFPFSGKHAKWQLRLSNNKGVRQLVRLARIHQYKLHMFSCLHRRKKKRHFMYCTSLGRDNQIATSAKLHDTYYV